jgi:hypothetical protein
MNNPLKVKIMKQYRFLRIITLVILIGIGLSACTEGTDTPAQTVELYYNALAEKDQNRLISLTYADYESIALLEFDSFASVETTLKDFSCQTIRQDGDTAYVTCEGAISASYQGEAREFPLNVQTFTVVKQGGEWLMCGYE